MSMYDTAAEGIKYYGQQGAAIAEGQRQSGQIWGQTLASLGQMVANLPGQLAQQKELALRGQVTQAQLAQMKAAQEGQQRANQVIASLPKNGDGLFDTAAMAQQFAGANVPLPIAESFISSADKMNAIHRQTNQDKIDRLADVADVILSSHKAGEPITPDALHLGFASAKNMGLASDADEQKFTELAASTNPEGLLKGIRRLSKKYADLDKAIVLPRPGAVGTTAGAIQEAGGQVAAPNLPTTPKNETELAFDASDPKSPTAAQSKAALETMLGPRNAQLEIERQNSARSAAAQAETARHNKVEEGIAGRRLSNEDVPVNLTSQGLDIAAENFAKTGQLPPMGMGKQGASVRTKIINRAAEMHPTMDLASNRADFEANKKSLDKIQPMRDAVVSFENTATKNLDRFIETAKGVIDTGSPLLNSPLRSVAKSTFGSANQAAFDAARLVAQNEIAKVTSNPNLTGALSDSARKEVEAAMSPNASMAQIYSTAKVLKADMQARHQALDEQIGAIKGRIGAGSGGLKATLRFNPATGKLEPVQ